MPYIKPERRKMYDSLLSRLIFRLRLAGKAGWAEIANPTDIDLLDRSLNVWGSVFLAVNALAF